MTIEVARAHSLDGCWTGVVGLLISLSLEAGRHGKAKPTGVIVGSINLAFFALDLDGAFVVG